VGEGARCGPPRRLFRGLAAYGELSSARLRGPVVPRPYRRIMAVITSEFSGLGRAAQLDFEDLGTPLRDVTFVVVDLETTGGSPSDAGITEIGAVKVRGGEVLGEFQTLVDPGVGVPAFVSVLTGITDSMLIGAPTLGAAVMSFLEFASFAPSSHTDAGSVLVAHNAPYDVGFLKAASAKYDYPWPTPTTIDTARLARAVLLPDEVRNCKLGTLAAHFRSATEPNHRALSDARATVDVLHGLLERVGPLGVHSLEELSGFSTRVAHGQRRKRHLADGLPTAPGVYVFRDERGRALYVGKSQSIRTRVRTYFTASEKRTRMAEMVQLASSVTPIVCATDLEAEVRELRLIAEHKPPYNRRSRHPERALWLKLTTEVFPRLSIVREVRDDTSEGACYIGPFPGRRAAEHAAEALLESVSLRTCTTKLSPRRSTPPCVLHEIGRCAAPCSGAIGVTQYAELADRARSLLTSDVSPMTDVITARMSELATAQRFEEAAAWRDRLATALRGITRTHRVGGLADLAEVVAGRPRPDGGWDVHVIRYGRLAGATVISTGSDIAATVEALRATSEVVARPFAPAPAALVEETERIVRWLESDGVRLVHLELPAAKVLCADRQSDKLAAIASPGSTSPGSTSPGSTSPGWTSPRHSPVPALRRITASSSQR